FGMIPVNSTSSLKPLRLATSGVATASNVTARFTSSTGYFKIVDPIPSVIDSTVIRITFSPTFIGGMVADSLLIHYKTGGGKDSFDLLVHLQGTGSGVVPNFTATNGARLKVLDFQTVQLDSTRDTVIQITNTGNVELIGRLY